MQVSENTLPTQAEYLLQVVNQEMDDLRAQTDELDATLRYGGLLALAKIRGRLNGMIQVQSWGPNPLWRS